MRCVWLLCAFRSAQLAIDGVAGCCDLVFPYNPAQRERLDPEYLLVNNRESRRSALCQLVLFVQTTRHVPGQRDDGLQGVGPAVPSAAPLRAGIRASARAVFVLAWYA